MSNIRFGGIAAAFLLALTACGGGGGGGGLMSEGPQPTGYQSTRYAISPTHLLLAAPQPNRERIEKAGEAAPRFGSVTQSANVDGNGVTTDRAGATLENDKLTVTVTRGDDSSFTFNTVDDRTGVVSEFTDEESIFVKQTGGGAETESTLAYTALTSTGDGATDWLTAGAWLQQHGDIGAGRIDRIEAGAFVDGPELREDATLPQTGTAHYHGSVYGLYGKVSGPDDPDDIYWINTTELGDYWGNIMLTADFGGKTVSGEIDYITLSGNDREDSVRGSRYGVDTGYIITLGDASVAANGRFASEDVTVANPDFVRVASFSGSWGGRFSSEADANGNPRVVAGTHGATMRSLGGTEISFIGAFYGKPDRYAADR